MEGAELKALNSLGEKIKSIDFALVEVSIRKNFKDGPLLWDIDNYMIKNKFARIYIKTGAASGDALYKKMDKVQLYWVCKMRMESFLMRILAALQVTDFLAVLKKKCKSYVSL